MEDEILTLLTKSYNRHLVAETNKYPSLFKYCSFDGGFQMLRAMNLQFTRADGLNDEFEVNLSKTNIETHLSSLRKIGISNDMLSDKLQDSINFFSGIGICSCGKTAHNDTLWERYSSNNGIEDGLCIELDQDKVINHLLSKNIKIMTLLVNYFEDVSKIIPWELFLGNTVEKQVFLRLLYTSKLKAKWGEEDEIRFIYSEPFSGKHFRPLISPKCIKTVYLGRDMSRAQRIKIGQILNRYSHIKRNTTH